VTNSWRQFIVDRVAEVKPIFRAPRTAAKDSPYLR
jgi:hypothetical protein